MAGLLLMGPRGFIMNKNIFFCASSLLVLIASSSALVHAESSNEPKAYRCVLNREMMTPGSLANGSIDAAETPPLADIRLGAEAESVSQVLSTTNNQDPSAPRLQFAMYRSGDLIQAVIETVTMEGETQNSQVHLAIGFGNGDDPRAITHASVSNDAGTTQETIVKRKGFFGFGRKTVVENKKIQFVDAPIFDASNGVDLQCALAR
jgi:hypothetical protein